MDLDKIGKFISSLRKKKKLTQLKLAELTGASDKTISKWENGNSFPDLVYQSKLCEVLDIYLEELHSGEFNTERRKREKRRKIINKLITVYAAITIPLIIFLCFFFINNYDATKIYKLKTADNVVEAVVNGLLIETNKTNLIYIGNIDTLNYEVKDTDIISTDVYSGKSLVYHSNKLDSLIIKYDNHIEKSNLRIIIEIIDISKQSHKFEIKLDIIDIFSEENPIKTPRTAEINLLSEQDIANNLKANEFKKTGDSWQKIIKTKKKKETIEYLPLQDKLTYDIVEETIFKNIIYNISTARLYVYIFHDDEDIHTLIEKYVYHDDTDTLECQYGSCSSLPEVLKTLDPYITLLTGE